MSEQNIPKRDDDPGLDIRQQNFADDVSKLPKGQQGFFGTHLASGEDGHLLVNRDGKPITLQQMDEYKQGGADPFRPEDPTP